MIMGKLRVVSVASEEGTGRVDVVAQGQTVRIEFKGTRGEWQVDDWVDFQFEKRKHG